MKTRRFKLWQKILLVLVSFIVLVLFLAPRIAKRYVINNSDKLIGRMLDIDKIRLNYFSGALKIKSLVLYEEDKNSTFVSFEKLKVNLDYWPLFKREVRFSEITLNELYSQVEQRGEWFNFSDLTEASDSTQQVDPDEEEVTTKEAFGITINNINLVDCQILYSDLLLDHTITLQDIDLHIPGFALRSGSTDLAVDFDFVKGGSLYSALSFNQVDSTFALNLQLDSLNVDIIEPYIKQSLNIAEINGYFSNNIILGGNLQHIADINMSGWNQIDALHIIDHQERNILSFKQFKLLIDTLLLDRNQIRLGQISLVDPLIIFELIDTTNNWMAMMVLQDSIQKDTVVTDISAVSDEHEFDISMRHLSLQDGKIVFYDKTLSQDFESEIHNINIESRDLGTSAEEVRINLTAELNQTAKILSGIVVNPRQMDDLEIEFELQHFVMNDIEPYMQHYFGYPIEEGLLNFKTRNDISGMNISSDNNILVRQLELGKPDKKDAQIKLPLRLALGILSDRSGIIDLDIPVRISDKETSIENLWKIILRTIGNLFVKAATSPVDMLSSLYDADPEKLKEIKVGMFDRIPGDDGLESLDLIAKILYERPKLRVGFIYAMDKEVFTDTLSYIKAVESFREKEKDEALSNLDPLPDSLLEAFLRNELSGSEVPENTSLENLFTHYTKMNNLAAQYDSTRLEQTDFINDYLRENKSVPPDRISFSYEVPDSMGFSRTHALLHVIFKSLDSAND